MRRVDGARGGLAKRTQYPRKISSLCPARLGVCTTCVALLSTCRNESDSLFRNRTAGFAAALQVLLLDPRRCRGRAVRSIDSAAGASGEAHVAFHLHISWLRRVACMFIQNAEERSVLHAKAVVVANFSI